MKKIILSLILSLFVVYGVPAQIFNHNTFSTESLYVQAKEEIVAFNQKTLKYHKLSCRWAIRCTKNCINIPKSEAIKRGGIPCKVCGG